MTKETFKNAFKNIFRKTRIVCPHCGTVQRHDADTCCICGNDLKFLHDDTYKLKNIIRVSLGCITAAVIVAATLIVCNIIKSSDSDKPVSKEAYADETTESVEETNEATEPVTTEQKAEEPTTEKATEKPTEKPTDPPTEAPTEAPTTPDQLVEWVCRPAIQVGNIRAGSDIIREECKNTDGNWWNRVFLTDDSEAIDDGNGVYFDLGLADYAGNIIFPASAGINIDQYNKTMVYMPALNQEYNYMRIDDNGNNIGIAYTGYGSDSSISYNTYDGKYLIWSLPDTYAHATDHPYCMYDDKLTGINAVYYDGEYVGTENRVSDDSRMNSGIDKEALVDMTTGKAVAIVDEVFRVDQYNKKWYGIVRNGSKYTYLYADGTSVVPGEYEEAYQFRDGMAAVKKNGKAGFINSKGETVVPFIFEETRNCYDGKAWVKYNGLWGVIKVK